MEEVPSIGGMQSVVRPEDRILIQPLLDAPDERWQVTIFSVDASGIRKAPSFEAQNLLWDQIPDHRQKTTTDYVVGVTNDTVIGIATNYGNGQIIWPQGTYGERAKEEYNSRLLSLALKEQVVTAQETFGNSGELPPDAVTIKEHPDYSLRDFQRMGIWAAMRQDYALFFEQGTGKTYTSIALICNEAAQYASEGKPYRCLVIVPSNLRYNWIKEVRRMSFVPTTCVELKGGQAERLAECCQAMVKGQSTTATIVISSYDAAVRDVQILKAFEWDRMICDESQYFKDPSTSRFKAIRQLRDHAKRRLILTGTPVGNSAMDLYAQLESLAPGTSGFIDWKDFRKAHGIYVDTPTKGVQALVAVTGQDTLRKRVAHNSMVVRKADVLKHLPDIVYETLECQMTPEQQKAYTQMAETLMAQIEKDLAENESSAALVNNILTKLLRLNQITSGYLSTSAEYDTEGEEVQRGVIHWFDQSKNPEAKVAQLKQLLDELPEDEKCVIWSCWVPALEMLSFKLQEWGYSHSLYYGQTSAAEKRRAEDSFNANPKCRVFLSNQAAGGTGLNLLGYPPGQGAMYNTDATLMVFYAGDWSYLKRAQAEARSHREGTRRQLRIVDLMVRDTIDEEIAARVEAKKNAARDMTELKEVLGSVKGLLRRATKR